MHRAVTMIAKLRPSRLLGPILVVMLAVGPAEGQPTGAVPADCGAGGGLCVQVGCTDVAAAAGLAQSGRFLVQVLDTDAAAVERARRELQSAALYGLASADRLDGSKRLPYTDNLVNLLLIGDHGGAKVPLAEIARVLCPHGVVNAAGHAYSAADFKAAALEVVQQSADGSRIVARKPWPAEMDQWSHPRHAAGGNAVSGDRLVGPPRRIRWVAGPPQEISNMVSSAGRNFYAGVLARDGFNGLKLWQRAIRPSPARGGYGFRSHPGSVRPVAAGKLLLVVAAGKLTAIDGATGEDVRSFPEAGTPTDLLHLDGTLIAVDGASVRALDLHSGRLRWKHTAAGPRYVVAGDGAVYLLQGAVRQGQALTAVSLQLDTGRIGWRRGDFDFAAKVRRCVYDRGLLAYEVSTLNNDKPGNTLHVVSAADGRPLWSHTFVPGMAHMKQARAMFIGPLVWVLDDRKCVGLERRTGKVAKTYRAGWGHCFPPVATGRFLFGGEMDLTDLETGQVDANRITKGNCSRDAGFVPANGLVYVTPKHCICWPMLRGYAALAPPRPGGGPMPERLQDVEFVLQPGVDPPANPPQDSAADWPCYRHDAWRSGSTPERVPADLKTLWKTELGGLPDGPIADDWRDNPFVAGPVTPPVIAGGSVLVARPDAHQVVALDSAGGGVRWRFTANGRIDSAVTLCGGLCLFGTKSGWVYCLGADDGRLVWRLRAAPADERIVAYGQLESPWPVPGSVLVVDRVAYFAAGRQSLADGGILVFAVQPATGKARWVKRLDTVPQNHFYGGLGLEFDNFDLMHREGDCVAMSRWLFDRRSGRMRIEAASGFALLKTGGPESNPAESDRSGAMVPRGCWSYAPRHQSEQDKTRPYRRPLAVFRGNSLWGCSQDKRTVYRRDFNLAGGQQFDTVWSVRSAVGKSGDRWRSERLARGAKWSIAAFDQAAANQQIAAMVLAGETLLAAGWQGGLTMVAAEDGKLLGQTDLPPPVWDGMAVAAGRLFVSTRDGAVVCLGQ